MEAVARAVPLDACLPHLRAGLGGAGADVSAAERTRTLGLTRVLLDVQAGQAVGMAAAESLGSLLRAAVDDAIADAHASLGAAATTEPPADAGVAAGVAALVAHVAWWRASGDGSGAYAVEETVDTALRVRAACGVVAATPLTQVGPECAARVCRCT